MSYHETIDSLADHFLAEEADFRSALIYAPNTIGKTRLAQYLKDCDPDGVILYNSYVEDVFSWDNERTILTMNPGDELVKTIGSQGLDRNIVDYFKSFTSGRIEPTIDFASGEISFGVYTGDDRTADGIKISRAEESIFVWCVYYSVLCEAIDTLADSADLRSTTDYDHLKLAVIDDPVSSMDDVRIVSVALAIAEIIKRASELDLRFIVTTHHALFFNVLFHSLGRHKKRPAFTLQRHQDTGWVLSRQPNDAPFSSHLQIIEDIKQAISSNAIQRVHFNQFRAILEKVANFLGYAGGWGNLLTGPNADVVTRILNLYSHDRFSDLEPAQVYEEYRDAFQVEFETFLKEFKWAVVA